MKCCVAVLRGLTCAILAPALLAAEPRPPLPGDVVIFTYDGVVRVDANRKVTWECRTPEYSFVHDGWVLPNGNVMFAHAKGVVEVTPAKEIAWSLDLPRAISCQPLGDDRVLVLDEGKRELLEVTRSNKTVVRRVSLVREGLPPFAGYRLARQSPDGVTLVGCKSGRSVLAVSKEGEVTAMTPPIKGQFAFSAVRQPDASLLVTTVFDAQLVKLNPANERVWTFGNEDFPTPTLWGVTGTQTLPDGSFAVTNTDYHVKNLALAEVVAVGVSPEKKLFWTITRSELLPQLKNLPVDPGTGFTEFRHTQLQVLYPGWEKDPPVR
jgi:hypothetical protein